jgi:tetratricopeptide (TPR) repeat protein
VSLGTAFLALGRLEDARACYRAALRLQPRHPLAHNNLGNVFKAEGRWDEAVRCYREALRVQPDLALAHNNLGLALHGLGRYDDAVASFLQVLKRDSDALEALVNLGSTYHQQGKWDDAITCYRRAISLNPQAAEAHYNLGNALQEQGDFSGAAQQYLKTLRLKPRHASARYNLALSRRHSPAHDEEVAQITALLNEPLAHDARIRLEFSLAKIYDDSGRYDQAFDHCRRANELARPEFDRDTHRQFIDSLIRVFTREFLAHRTQLGLDSKLPIFIVGMPRSGTTLVEQILSSHPCVAGAGELPDLDKIARQLASIRAGLPSYPECLVQLDPADLSGLAESYLARLRMISHQASRITDKMPLNFLHIGLIARLFPEAVVIHCRREPLDVCLSCYFQDFSSRLPFAYDLSDLGFYYAQYERLMQHWQAASPLAMLDVSYEELVRNQESMTRKLLSFSGLSWDDRCLEFHRNLRPVQTASSWQVRQPMYSSSLGRWKNYTRHLKPLRIALRQGRDEAEG